MQIVVYTSTLQVYTSTLHYEDAEMEAFYEVILKNQKGKRCLKLDI